MANDLEPVKIKVGDLSKRDPSLEKQIKVNSLFSSQGTNEDIEVASLSNKSIANINYLKE